MQVQTVYLLDAATKIATLMKKGNTSKTQVENLLNFFRSSLDKEELMLFIMRQSGKRNGIDRTSAKELVLNINELQNNDDILRLLGYIKWVYESIENIENLPEMKNFSDLVNFFKSDKAKESRGERYVPGPRRY
ncbi:MULTISPECIES: hypothetical protein [Acidianus]|uniref:Uncharacterized protein n=1 Tax=Candidatus Acidianus copahuensis TaxID=1160895 RepID=A0A031LT22_9CREN|nr:MULTISPECIES: hypothetical protein [Acidianus]EZQ10609.1 hypothetical protein CM19_04085 [Candidatus Acidianus copahuensis]NON61602.1 hypothetical protein [Acidianus sp. RZ1]